MAITEERRHRMYSTLEDVMGHDDATTLIDHLPPVGWADVATKHDLAVLKDDLRALEDRLEQRFEALEHRIEAKLHREISSMKSLVITSIVASNATVAGVIVAAVNLF
jgi:hypothetical protein